MKKFYLLYFVVSILILLIFNGCNTSSSTDYPPSILYGKVIDSATHKPIDSAYVNTIPAGSGMYTDTGGNFRVTGIPMSSSGTNILIIASKGQYTNDTTYMFLLSNDSAYLVLSMNPSNGVYITNNVVLQKYSNQQTNSSLELTFMVSVPGEHPYRDLDLRDSMGLGGRFQFRSSNIDPILMSFETKMGYSLGGMTKYQFDTLRMIYGINNPPQDSDFPLYKTQYFYFPLVENSVFPFYLSGRYNALTGNSKIYGLLYVNSAWQDPNNNNIFISVDIKENRNGQNYFIPQSK